MYAIAFLNEFETIAVNYSRRAHAGQNPLETLTTISKLNP